MIIINELSFKVMESEVFRNYSHTPEPRFVVPSSIAIARDCMKIYKEEKLKLKQVLQCQ